MKDKDGYGIYHVNFLNFSPVSCEKGVYAEWYFSMPQLRYILDNWETAVMWKKLKDIDKPLDREKFHPTARYRKILSKPIKHYVETSSQNGTKRILYHGIGKDEIGLRALSNNGSNAVYGYDPFHPNKKYRSLPNGKFDEIHSHYTLNVVDKDEGKDIIGEICGKLLSGGAAIISVRRDLEATKKYRRQVKELYL